MLVLDNFIGNLWQNFLKFVKNNLILCICAAILIVLLIIGLIAFRFNYRTQMKVSVLMDNESDTFNKPGLVKYFQEYGGKLASPALVVVHLQNLNFLYQSYPKRHQLMVTVANQMLKGLGARETVGRAEFDRFIVLLDKSNLEEEIKLHLRDANDKYSYYIEMVSDPSTMFELVKYGQTFGYIEIPNDKVSTIFENQLTAAAGVGTSSLI